MSGHLTTARQPPNQVNSHRKVGQRRHRLDEHERTVRHRVPGCSSPVGLSSGSATEGTSWRVVPCRCAEIDLSEYRQGALSRSASPRRTSRRIQHDRGLSLTRRCPRQCCSIVTRRGCQGHTAQRRLRPTFICNFEGRTLESPDSKDYGIDRAKRVTSSLSVGRRSVREKDRAQLR
jgi:hypothetical protein